MQTRALIGVIAAVFLVAVGCGENGNGGSRDSNRIRSFGDFLARVDTYCRIALRDLAAETKRLVRLPPIPGVSSPYEDVIDEMILLISDMNIILDRIKTVDDVAREARTLKRIAAGMKALTAHAQQLGQPSKEVMQRIQGRLLQMMTTAVKLTEKVQRLPPDVRDELNKFDLKLN